MDSDTFETQLAGDDVDEVVGLITGMLTVQGGVENMLRMLHEECHFPIYTAVYDPARFDERFRTAVKGHVTQLYVDAETESSESLGDLFRSSDYSAVNAIEMDSIDVDQITDASQSIDTGLLLTMDADGTEIAYRSGIPFVAYMQQPPKMWTDYKWEVFDQNDGIRDKLSWLKEAWSESRKFKHAHKAGERILVNSNRTVHTVSEGWGIPTDALHVVYPPVNRATYTPDGPADNPLDLDEYFIATQRLDGMKNVHVLIEAAKAAQIDLVITGTGELDDYVRTQSQFSDFIHFLGYMEEDRLVKLFRGATALVQGRLGEDFGMVAAEAMACGTPTIAPASGGFLETIGNGYDPDHDGDVQTDRGYLLDAKTFNAKTLASTLRKFDRDDYADSNTLHDETAPYGLDRFIDQVSTHLSAVVDEL